MRVITIMRCASWIALGASLALTGAEFFTWRGAAVWGLLLVIALLDGYDAKLTYRRGVRDGMAYAIFKLHKAGWRKS